MTSPLIGRSAVSIVDDLKAEKLTPLDGGVGV